MFRRAILSLAALSATIPVCAQLRAIPYVTGLSNPMAMIQDPTRMDTQYVVQRGGTIKVVQNGSIRAANFLDISSLTTTDGERGLLNLAFAPDYALSGNAYIYYTDLSGTIQIKRYTRSTSDPFVLDAATVHNVISIAHPNFNNHNGGTITFGPDGYLYAAMGDGGNGNDPNNNAQNPNILLGKMIRIDPSTDAFPTDAARNYSIPSTNPFANGGGPVVAMGEIWAFGYRNPFKFSFDNAAIGGTGGLVVGDVGQDAWEEVDYEPVGSGGHNYGWRQREGAHNTGLGGSVAFTPVTDPIFEYAHSGDSKAIIGGYVYHGGGIPGYEGRYFFADEVTSQVWSLHLKYDQNGMASASDLQEHTSALGATAIGNPSSFAIDAHGDVYIVNLTGGSISMIASTNTTISGHVTLDGLTGAVSGKQVTIQVRRPGTTTALDTYVATLDSSGNFSVATNRIGTFDVAIKGSHWLRKVIGNVSFGSGGANGLSAELVNGDVNGDNVVSLADFNALRTAFNASPSDPNWNANADLNGDATVSLSDFSILRSSFNLSGDN